MNILCVFKILWCSGGIRAIQGGKCDQPTQFLKRHGIKRHGESWCLKRHSPWVIWNCHLMPFKRSKHHFKLYPSDWGFFRSYVVGFSLFSLAAPSTRLILSMHACITSALNRLYVPSSSDMKIN